MSVTSPIELAKPIYLEYYAKWIKVLGWLECRYSAGLSVSSIIIIMTKSTYL